MSEENVEIVRASIEAFQRGEYETSLSYYSEDLVFHPLVAGPYHGRRGVVEQMAVRMEEFDNYWFEGGLPRPSQSPRGRRAAGVVL